MKLLQPTRGRIVAFSTAMSWVGSFAGCQNPQPPSARTGDAPAPPITAVEAKPPVEPQAAASAPVSNPLPPAAAAPSALPQKPAAEGGPRLDGRPSSAGPRQGLLLPPAAHGKFKTALSGCLTEPEATRARVGAPATDSEPKLTVAATGTGIVVAHDFGHACCLEATVDVKVKGKTVQLTERLTGEACRCRCSSTIKTAIGLEPGDYELVVNLTGDGAKRAPKTEAVSVPKL